MNLEYRMNEYYDSLTANDREVMSLILRDKGGAGQMNRPPTATCPEPL